MNHKTIIAIGATGIVLYMLAKREGAKLADDIGEAVNPTSDQNVVYKGVNAVGATITGKQKFNLGHWLYDVVNG